MKTMLGKLVKGVNRAKKALSLCSLIYFLVGGGGPRGRPTAYVFSPLVTRNYFHV